MADEATKVCTKCGEEKSLSAYRKRSGGKGLRSWCNFCAEENRRSYRAAYSRERKRELTIRQHGITLEYFLSLLKEQGNRCAICGKVPEDVYDLYIDHDHECCPGKTSCGECVRGLLCQKCNSGLGMFDDNLNNLQSAVKYLSGGELDGR